MTKKENSTIQRLGQTHERLQETKRQTSEIVQTIRQTKEYNTNTKTHQ